jgi:hypothetical protein
VCHFGTFDARVENPRSRIADAADDNYCDPPTTFVRR